MELRQDDRSQVRDRVRRLINLQREFNDQVHRFSQESSDPEVQQTLGEIARRGYENVNKLSRLLAIKCTA